MGNFAGREQSCKQNIIPAYSQNTETSVFNQSILQISKICHYM